MTCVTVAGPGAAASAIMIGIAVDVGAFVAHVAVADAGASP